MAVYLFDEKRWYEYNPDDYASLIKGAVTDLIVLVLYTGQCMVGL